MKTDRENKKKNLKDNQLIEEELENEGILKPPDGGYGWVVVLGAFFANIIVDGVGFTIGDLLIPKWLEEFETSQSSAALVTSILQGTYLLIGPVASALANNLGCHVVVVIGALLASAGFLLSALVPSLPILYITFGLISGSGFGFMFLTAIVIVSTYFDNNRALATGITVCGSGIGTMFFGYINPILLNLCNNNWRIYLGVASCFTFSVSICGFIYKPLKPTEAQVNKVAKIATEYLDIKDTDESNINNLTTKSKSSYVTEGVEFERFSQKSRSFTNSFNSSRPFLSTLELHVSKKQNQGSWSQHDIAASATRDSVIELNRPLSKVDIFLPTSMENIRQRSSSLHGSIKKKHISKSTSNLEEKPVLMLSTLALSNGEEYDESGNISWKKNVSVAVKKILDPSLLKLFSFIIFALSGFFTFFCFFVPYIYLGRQALSKGVPESQKNNLLIYLGLVNTIARVLCGYIADKPSVDALQISNISIIIGGIATCFVPFLSEYWMFVIYTIPFALGVACFSALRSVICVELYGIEKLTNAFGILLLFMGFAAVSGAPFAGFIADITGNMDYSWYIMGSIMILSGMITIPIRKIVEWENKKNNNIEHDGVSELEALKENH
ncbi:Major facilitator superfamily and Major facilitator superfamily domain, general substrate transporter and Major facilitator superfamily domain-containing protein [Strongyloides ratti]|uniref:Major facilitator superfamily and Major facilitator superfamily domain, general substrate transporter and Major facilitator superfamily domain-containing protein n=1 Tax=Strongyloides ratti TaxID=34506 RepID=A0A090KSB2_STRRB|nr:Major facilitator superfamily and Major facilitator superfamily domain, general substrate transporter and Major facilitator superfamily domain-containing protein [Strongyloides ratti]CEF60281.1 Major facilitator superfamily and Major facilitator superfamily domain, general substrate transporter and Major facilitator superfamily domain-containing protein [Strongyloides ratti]